MAFYQEIRYCIVPDPSLLGDGICQNFDKYNTPGCNFDDGDCSDFNGKKYSNDVDGRASKKCKAPYPFLLDDDKCDGPKYNNPECNYDEKACIEFNNRYPNCTVEKPSLIGNGKCDGGDYNTSDCGWDGEDCLDFWALHPNCDVDKPSWIGDGICDTINPISGNSNYNTAECGYDAGDCISFNLKYPGCIVHNTQYVGDGFCDTTEIFEEYLEGWHGIHYNSSDCKFDGGDCLLKPAVEEFPLLPNCFVVDPSVIGDGKCDGGDYNTADCKFDGGDCLNFNQDYPDCGVYHPSWIGDGRCHGAGYNTEACGYDGGDCFQFNLDYPLCKANFPFYMGDGNCDFDMTYMDSPECGYDDGDCLCKKDYEGEYPECQIDDPCWIADGLRHSIYNKPECEFDGGDCLQFNSLYPDCTVDFPDLIGNLICNRKGGYNTPECGYDGGDCVELNQKYKDCKIEDMLAIDDGICDGEYNIPQCNFDGGDCADFNQIYPNCFGANVHELGDGVCQHNTEACNYDDGDCDFFNTLYPKCKVNEPYLIGDGYCNAEYNTEECKRDGGDCISENAAAGLFVNGQLISIEEYKQDTRTYSIIQTVSSIASLISSAAIIWILYRSFLRGMSLPYHRLLLGLSIADICSSVAQSFSTLPAPDPLDIIWNARGTKVVCQLQGFFIVLGSIGAPLYNCSLCFYYLIVITYKRKNADAYVRKKFEIYLHAVPIATALIGATTILAMDAFHPNMTYCFIGADPACDDVDSCDKTNRTARVLFVVFSAGPYLILPCVISSTMICVYRVVRAKEKKERQFGVHALRRTIRDRNNATDANLPANIGQNNDDEVRGSANRLRDIQSVSTRVRASILSLSVRSRTSEARSSIGVPNNADTKSRGVLNKAFANTLAFFLTFLFPIIISIRTLSGYDSGPVLSILARIFFPLQGLFNFIVFIHPRVLGAKKRFRSEDITWFRAFLKAIQSRGPHVNNSTRITSARSGGTRRMSCFISYIFRQMKRKLTNMIMRARRQHKENVSSNGDMVGNEGETRLRVVFNKIQHDEENEVADEQEHNTSRPLRSN